MEDGRPVPQGFRPGREGDASPLSLRAAAHGSMYQSRFS